jgi:hypothetical protein
MILMNARKRVSLPGGDELVAHAAELAAAAVDGRKLKLKAKLESGSSSFSFKMKPSAVNPGST